jgi:hypothetical protein
VVAEDGSTPVSGAAVTAWWVADSIVDGETQGQMVVLGTTTTDSNGSYAVNGTATPEMMKAAADNGGWLNFAVSSSSTSLDMATTMMVSRQLVGQRFKAPTPPKRAETVDNPALQRALGASASARLASAEQDENPTVPASVAPDLTLVLSEDIPDDSEGAGSASRAAAAAAPVCYFHYGADTQERTSVVEFHNASNANGKWTYGEKADSDIDVAIKYVGDAWKVNGSDHVSNEHSLSVGQTYNGGDTANNYGRSDFLVRHATVEPLAGSAPDGTQCYEFPDDIRVGTKTVGPKNWVGGVGANSALPGAEYIGCSYTPQSTHRTSYATGTFFNRGSKDAAKIAGAVDLGPLTVGAKSGFSTNMSLHYDVVRGNGIWLCGTNYFPDTAGVVHAQSRP